MISDLGLSQVLLMTGNGFTPAQQVWPSRVVEGYAQLMGKRVQRKILGPVRSICWTDHADFTKQQVFEPIEIDVKLLRWASEIIADGSEVRSLTGRAVARRAAWRGTGLAARRTQRRRRQLMAARAAVNFTSGSERAACT